MFCYSITKMEKNSLKQFCVRLGKSATEKIQKASGNDSLSRAQVLLWLKDFEIGRETVEDEPLS
jgi:hypothetical protein